MKTSQHVLDFVKNFQEFQRAMLATDPVHDKSFVRIDVYEPDEFQHYELKDGEWKVCLEIPF